MHDEYRGGLSIRADRVSGLEDVRLARAACVEMQLSETWVRQPGKTPVEAIAELKSLLEPASGGDCEVRLRYRRAGAEVPCAWARPGESSRPMAFCARPCGCWVKTP